MITIVMEILINNIQNRARVPQKKIIEKCKNILSYLSLNFSELSILITDDKEIRRLNKLYRNKDKKTNVLSFPPEKKFKKIQNNILGDIVISMERVKEEAKEYKITINQRLSQLLTHSILHLLGYKHSEEMEKKSLKILKVIEKDKNLSFM